MAAKKAAYLRALLRRMQTVLMVRRTVYRRLPPVVSAPLDTCLRQLGWVIVAEMRRLEGDAKHAAR